MANKTTSLSDVVKKPRSYLTDMDTLKAEILESSAIANNIEKSDIPYLESNHSQISKSLDQEQIKNTSNYHIIVGLHVPIPQDLRDKLKVKTIKEGKKMKDAVVELIQDYVNKA